MIKYIPLRSLYKRNPASRVPTTSKQIGNKLSGELCVPRGSLEDNVRYITTADCCNAVIINNIYLLDFK